MTQRLLPWSALMAVVAGFALGGSATAASGSASGDFAAAEAAAFTEADANRDGKLTPEEFARYGALLRQKLDALRFARLDTNGDGALTEDELNAAHPAGCAGFPPPPAF
jgi:hypothetical protein